MERQTHEEKTSPLAERFWEKVNKEGPIPTHVDGIGKCWVWTGAHEPGGRGQLGLKRKGRQRMFKAHRISWSIHNGPAPKGMCVCHKCDFGLCVNPNHLFLGTIKENVHDMIKKGRQGYYGSPGEKHPLTKLTEEKVKQIRALHKTGKFTGRKLAKDFGVSHHVISFIVTRRTWKHLL